MNFKRGLLRLWIVGTAFWGLICLGMLWSEIRAPYLPEKYFVYAAEKGLVQLNESFNWYAVDTSKLQRVQLRDRQYVIGNIETASTVLKAAADEVPGKLNRDTEIADRRRQSIITLAVAIVAPSVLLLALGSGLVWAFSGFRRSAL